jgi:hypothetical protein
VNRIDPSNEVQRELEIAVAAARNAHYAAGWWAQVRAKVETRLGTTRDDLPVDDAEYGAALDRYSEVQRLLGDAERLHASWQQLCQEREP